MVTLLLTNAALAIQTPPMIVHKIVWASGVALLAQMSAVSAEVTHPLVRIVPVFRMVTLEWMNAVSVTLTSLTIAYQIVLATGVG